MNNLEFYLKNWMKYAYTNSAYINCTKDALRLLHAVPKILSAEAPEPTRMRPLGETYQNMLREFEVYLAKTMPEQEFEEYMSNLTGNSPEKFKKKVNEIIRHSILNATSGWDYTQTENIDVSNFDMVIRGLLGDSSKPWFIDPAILNKSVFQGGINALVNTVLRTAALADGYEIAYGSKADECFNHLSTAVSTGSPAAWVKFCATAASAPTHKINSVFEAAGDNFDAEWKAMEMNKTKLAHYVISTSNQTVKRAGETMKTREQYIQILTEEVTAQTKVLKQISEAQNQEDLQKIAEDYFVEFEPVTLSLTDKVSLAFREDIADSGAQNSVSVFRDGTNCSDQFHIALSGSHGITVTPKETVAAEETYKIVYTQNRKHVIHPVTFCETAQPSGNTGVAEVVVSLKDGGVQTVTFATDTAEIIGMDKVENVTLQDANATCDISYDNFGNAYITVTNGICRAIYSIRNILPVTSSYTMKVIKDSENSVKISCDFAKEEQKQHLMIGVYNAKGQLVCLESYDSEKNCAKAVPYIDGGTIGLVCIDMTTMLPLTEKVEIR